MLDDTFDEMLAAEYESFHVDDAPECDVFEFDDLCSTADCLLTSVPESAPESICLLALELKPLPDSLNMHSYDLMNPYLSSLLLI